MKVKTEQKEANKARPPDYRLCAEIEEKLVGIGGVWENTDKNGKPYWSVSINLPEGMEELTLNNKDKLVMFKNEPKEAKKEG